MAENREHRILVAFYSLTGKTAELAKAIAAGAAKIPGINVQIKRIPELLPESFFDGNPKLKASRDALMKEFPEATPDDLINADGVAIGTPVHFGSFASQVKQYLDQLSPIWLEGKLVNKPVALFCTGGSLHGGEEVTLISLMIPLLNLGMIPVGIPYPIQGTGPEFDAGSPYGAVFVTGHRGQENLTEDDIKVAHILGGRLATMTQLLTCACESCANCRIINQKIK